MNLHMIVGGAITVGGLAQLLLATPDTKEILKSSEGKIRSTNERIARVASHMFLLLGQFLLALGTMAMGATLVSAAPLVTFAQGFNHALHSFFPYFLSGMIFLAAGQFAFEEIASTSAKRQIKAALPPVPEDTTFRKPVTINSIQEGGTS